MNIVPFVPAHVGAMIVQPAQAGDIDAESLSSPYGMAWTAMDGEQPIACAGLVEVWSGRAYAWALLSADAGRHMVSITRAIRYRLDTAKFNRIELAVAAGFAPGVRFARLLGFELEAKARRYMPNGGDAFIFVRV
jgi:hypothetical protein